MPDLLFVRHGETEYNRRHVRCGGDVDIPLTTEGERQAWAAGEQAHAGFPGIDAILASPLQRTLHTAAIIADRLGGRPVIRHEGLRERRLGAWNGLPIEETQPLLDAGACPPGGESEAEFRQRVSSALADILSRGDALPLLVSSKGVGRILGLIAGDRRWTPAANGEIRRLTVVSAAEPVWSR